MNVTEGRDAAMLLVLAAPSGRWPSAAKVVKRPHRLFIAVSMAGDGPAAKKAKTEANGADASNGLFSRHSVCLVLDYGSQYTQLIARRVRENGVLSMLMPGDVTMVCVGGHRRPPPHHACQQQAGGGRRHVAPGPTGGDCSLSRGPTLPPA